MSFSGNINYKEGNYICSLTTITDTGNALLGDKIRYNNDGVVTDIIERSYAHIQGILKIKSKTKFGVNKRGVPIYLFKPYHKKYPNFLVCTKIKSDKNIFCNISFNKWDKNRRKFFGKLENVIGKVGVYDDEIQYILNQYHLNYKKWNSRTNKLLEGDCEIDDSVDIDYKVVSIDPEGSTDIDDAFHCKTVNGNVVEYGVHIADPLFYLVDKPELLKLIMHRMFTIYTDSGKNDMIPPLYSDNLVSLIQDRKRRAISVIFKNDGTVSLKRTVVKNLKQFTYEEADKVLKKGRYRNVNDRPILYLGKYFGITDSHKLIEMLMVKTNQYIGNLIVNEFGESAVLRKHKCGNSSIPDVDSEDLQKFLNLKQMKRAVYDFSVPGQNKHYGLNISNYTHFTSPIRRFFDMIVHNLVYKHLGITERLDIPDTHIVIDEINSIESRIKKADRKLNKLRLIKNLEKMSLSKKITEVGYITEIHKNSIYVYIPKYNLEEKIYLIPFKFRTLYKSVIEDDEIVVYNGDQVVCGQYKLYQKIDVTIIPFLNEEVFSRKIRIFI